MLALQPFSMLKSMNRELEKRQNIIIDELDLFPNWGDKFSHLIRESESMPLMREEDRPPDSLIPGCISRTYFKTDLVDGKISISGWSNASIPHALIALCYRLFNGLYVSHLQDADITFHIESGLIKQLTPPRASALQEMLRRILSLSR